MTGKTARLIFWLGTLSSAAIFLWMTYDFHMQNPKLTVSHGHLAFFGAYGLLNLTIFYFATVPGGGGSGSCASPCSCWGRYSG